MVNCDRLVRTEVNFTQAVTELVCVITATASTVAYSAVAMFSAAKISIENIDRRIRLRRT